MGYNFNLDIDRYSPETSQKFRPMHSLKSHWIFFVLPCLLGCGVIHSPDTQIPPPNIIWIVAEDISPALQCYGDTLAYTPNIDRLVESGIVFNKAYATAPICAPSRSCLMSGLYASSLGTQHLRCEIPFPDSLRTLPEHLARVGYFTSNRNKTDYNFDPEDRWTHWSGSYAPWRNRTDERPFFSFINVGPSHEGSANLRDRYEQSIEELTPSEVHDREAISPPPYYPNNAETREVWARYYDLLTAMDKNVGRILDSLEIDGLMENTIIFFFGDHGFGMPRYKRWLYNTGLHVPLIVHIPADYTHLFDSEYGAHNAELVSFVDFAPTVLSLAGAPIPPSMEGQVFLGPAKAPPRTHAFGARDRADDMFEMSRATWDSQYIYIRHYMPHLPYIQEGFINSDRKDSYRALRRAKMRGTLNTEQRKLWEPKPVEELYDLRADPLELTNLAESPSHQDIKSTLRQTLHHWMLKHKDLGLLTESEYMARSQNSSPYTYARTSEAYPVEEILSGAELVGKADLDQVLEKLKHPDGGVRYWAVMALRHLAFNGGNRTWGDKLTLDQLTEVGLPVKAYASLSTCLKDPSPSVQILAAETLAITGVGDEALETLEKWVASDNPRIALEAARAIQLVGPAARSLIPTMYQVIEKNLGEPGSNRKFKDFNYASFTGWSLEWALKNLGEDIQVN